VWDVRGHYDAALLLGNSIGLCGSLPRLHDLLKQLARCAPLVVLDSSDLGAPREIDRFRIEYAGAIGAWFQWLHVTQSDLCTAAAAAGFDCDVFDGDDGSYGAFLAKRHKSEGI